MNMDGMSMPMSSTESMVDMTTAITNSMLSIMTHTYSSHSSTAMMIHSMSNMNMSTMDHSSMNHSTLDHSSLQMSSGSMNMSMGHSMGGMDMMNSYLTTHFHNYPVLFKHLRADTSGKAFGIWLLLVVTAFVYKFLLFISWYLEIYWFKKWNRENKTKKYIPYFDNPKEEQIKHPFKNSIPTAPPNILFDIFWPSPKNLLQDFIRCLITFCATLLIYMLMLAAMTFVVTYVFGVVTGLALAEVFVNRVKLSLLKRWEIEKWIERKKMCNGHDNCGCCDPDNEKNGCYRQSTNKNRNSCCNHKKNKNVDNEDGSLSTSSDTNSTTTEDTTKSSSHSDVLKMVADQMNKQSQSDNMDMTLMPQN